MRTAGSGPVVHVGTPVKRAESAMPQAVRAMTGRSARNDLVRLRLVLVAVGVTWAGIWLVSAWEESSSQGRPGQPTRDEFRLDLRRSRTTTYAKAAGVREWPEPRRCEISPKLEASFVLTLKIGIWTDRATGVSAMLLCSKIIGNATLTICKCCIF